MQKKEKNRTKKQCKKKVKVSRAPLVLSITFLTILVALVATTYALNACGYINITFGKVTTNTEQPGTEPPAEETPGPDTETPGEETPGEETPLNLAKSECYYENGRAFIIPVTNGKNYSIALDTSASSKSPDTDLIVGYGNITELKREGDLDITDLNLLLNGTYAEGVNYSVISVSTADYLLISITPEESELCSLTVYEVE